MSQEKWMEELIEVDCEICKQNSAIISVSEEKFYYFHKCEKCDHYTDFKTLSGRVVYSFVNRSVKHLKENIKAATGHDCRIEINVVSRNSKELVGIEHG